MGVGGAPLAMLLRLDVELLRLPGPDKNETVTPSLLLYVLALDTFSPVIPNLGYEPGH